jgi:uncharacterized membrane protein (DUF373 family)
MTNRWRTHLFWSVQFIMALVFIFIPRISQNPSYHLFADQLMCFRVPNFQNVISNVIFLFAGLYGLRIALSNHRRIRPEKIFLTTFALGLITTAIGSAYYHWTPTNQTLVWDRLPMTLGFVGFFCWLLFKTMSPKFIIPLFYFLLCFGLFSVFYWDYTETQGFGDLRPYYSLQFGTVVNSFILLLLFQTADFSTKAFYVLAKIAEKYDVAIFSLTNGLLSGHSLKHWLAGLGCLLFFHWHSHSSKT